MNNYIVLFLCSVLIIATGCPGMSFGYSVFIDSANNGHASGIPAWLQSWGNTVTVVSDYKGENLAGYDVVMDFDNDAWNPLTMQEKLAYTGFLNQGGGLYLQGERPTNDYLLRDKSVLAYLSELGSGIIEVDWRDIFMNVYDPYVYAVSSPVTQNTSLRYHYDTSLIMTNPGNGFFVATTNEINFPDLTPPYTDPPLHLTGLFSNIIGFERGQLLNAPNGRVVGFFDTTYLDPGRFDENQPFFKEVVSFLGNSKSVTVLSPVPEPSTWVLLAVGCAFFLKVRSRK
jgi:hypothetical protein